MPFPEGIDGAGRTGRIAGIASRLGEAVGIVVPVVLLGVVIVTVGVDVFSRNVLRAPVFGASELAVLAFVWLVWLGVIGAAQRHELLGVEYFVDLLPHRARHLVRAAVNLLVVGIAAGVVYAGIMQIRTARFTTFMSIGVPKWVMSVGLVLSMLAVIVLYLANAVRDLRAARKPAP